MSQSNPPTPTTQSQASSGNARYYCHQCERGTPIYMAPDPTCQRCNGQFIEEMDDSRDPQRFLGATLDMDDDEDYDELGLGDDMLHTFRRTLGNNNNGGSRVDDDETPVDAMLQNILSGLLTSGTDEDDMDEQRRRRRRSQRRTPMVFFRNMSDGTMQVTPIDMSEVRQRRTGLDSPAGGDDIHNETQGTGNNNLQGLLQIISALTGANIVGNPNDYVSSRAALDNVITQLMEQTESASAPPPAPDDVISGLPKRPVSEQEFQDEVDCAVCKDDFTVTELVTELPCQHLFHDDCIKPWLKMNGTCPVCRHSLVYASTEGNRNNDMSSDQPDSTRSTTDSDDSSIVDSLLLNNAYAGRSAATQTTQGSSEHTPVTRATSTGPAAAPHFARLSRRPPAPWPSNISYGWGFEDNTYTAPPRRSTQDQHRGMDNVDMDIDLD